MRLLRILLLCSLPWLAAAQDTDYPPRRDQLPGPAQTTDYTRWLAAIRQWRIERLTRIGYEGSQYDREDLKWTQRAFVQPQMMVEERYFYDPVAGKYTVDRYLDDLDRRYGGIDAVLIWPVYPNIGVDNRSQFDLLRDLPGGIPGLRQMIADFHRRGVRVLFPTMAWDQGTRPEGKPHWEGVAGLMRAIGADGINGDTYHGLPRAFREAADQLEFPLALEPENPLFSDDGLAWQNLTWGYWEYPFVPMVSKLKWLEPRHMVNVCNRWARNKTDDLQAAFFNGVGFESWENIWGIWNGITPRDAETLRRNYKLLRRYADFLASPEWEPHTPTLQYGVFASRWPRAGQVLWTVVNRNPYALAGPQLRVEKAAGKRFFDLYHGRELAPAWSGGTAELSFELEALGYGAVLMQDGPADAAFLAEMAQLTAKPLSSFSPEWKPLPQTAVEIPKTKPAREAPAGMVLVPGAKEFQFAVGSVEIEGSNDEGTGVQYPWEPSPRRHHRHVLAIDGFYMDKYPVTNAEFKRFLEASGYRPKDDHNFLRDWKNGSYPEGWEKKPVTWVSIEDARAYAAWAGKRLPHEWEWQYAAQGTDGRVYPWGNEWNAQAVPPPDNSPNPRPATAVDAFPAGASPFGVIDLVGNVWQWTDEFQDEHTRRAILRGGSYYRPSGSLWYLPQARRNDQHNKYLLMAPSKDRSAMIGFRCVVDK